MVAEILKKEETKLVGPIKKMGRYLGVKFWAYFYSDDFVPRYEVYRYVGYQRDTGLHYFQSVKRPLFYIARNHNQLAQGGQFRPFCIDHTLVTEAIEGVR